MNATTVNRTNLVSFAQDHGWSAAFDVREQATRFTRGADVLLLRDLEIAYYRMFTGAPAAVIAEAGEGDLYESMATLLTV